MTKAEHTDALKLNKVLEGIEDICLISVQSTLP